MGDKSNDKRVSSSENRGLFGYLVAVPVYIFITLFVSALISTAIEWCGMAFDWWEPSGLAHSQAMVQQELAYLNIKLEHNALELFTGVTAKSIFDNTVGTIANWMSDLGVMSLGQVDGGGVSTYLGAAVNMMLLTFIRFFVFIFSLVMFAFFGVVGFVIGIFERDKRRAGGGRESGAIFKLSRSLVVPSFSFAAFLYLAWPNSIDPVFIIFPFAAGFGVAVAYTTASYKKYI